MAVSGPLMEVYFGVQVRPRGSLKDVLQNSWKVMCTREMLRDKLEDKVNKNIFKKKKDICLLG